MKSVGCMMDPAQRLRARCMMRYFWQTKSESICTACHVLRAHVLRSHAPMAIAPGNQSEKIACKGIAC